MATKRYELLGSGGLEYLESALAKVKHGDRVHLMLEGPGQTPVLVSSIEDAARGLGFAPPDGEDVMAWRDPGSNVHLRFQERTPDAAVLAPVLVVGLATLPLAFFLFREQTAIDWKKWMPFIIMGGLVVVGVVAVALSAKSS